MKFLPPNFLKRVIGVCVCRKHRLEREREKDRLRTIYLHFWLFYEHAHKLSANEWQRRKSVAQRRQRRRWQPACLQACKAQSEIERKEEHTEL